MICSLRENISRDKSVIRFTATADLLKLAWIGSKAIQISKSYAL